MGFPRQTCGGVRLVVVTEEQFYGSCWLRNNDDESTSTPYHAMGNGLVENFNKTLSVFGVVVTRQSGCAKRCDNDIPPVFAAADGRQGIPTLPKVEIC